MTTFVAPTTATTTAEDNDHDSLATTTDAYSSSSNHHYRPILVGYAFGPKKMSTMGVVMAEASKTKVSANSSTSMGTLEHPYEEDATSLLVVPRTVPIHSGLNATMLESCSNNHSNSNNTALLLSSAPTTTTTTSSSSSSHHDYFSNSNIVFSISGGPSGTGLKHIVRYFRKNCSSCQDDHDEDDTASMTKTWSTASSSYHLPIRNVSFVPLDLDSPLEEQHGGHFDVILHKMTEDCLVLSQVDDTLKGLVQHGTEMELQEALSNHASSLHQNSTAAAPSLLRIHRLIQYQREHAQHCAVVDHPSNVQVVMSRLEIATLLRTSLNGVCSTSGIPCQTPRFVHFTSATPPHHHNLNYPLIAKPLTAAGTKKSHCMGIVLHEAGLNHIGCTPCLLQEYANHNSILFKVYVLGDTVHVFSRPSIPDLPTHPNDLQHLDPYVEFDSQHPYPTLADFGLSSDIMPSSSSLLDDDLKHPASSSLLLQPEDLTPIVASLRNAFGLELFGFDILHAGHVLLVVDVNYFPSYKEVDNFPNLLAKYLTHRAIQNRKK